MSEVPPPAPAETSPEVQIAMRVASLETSVNVTSDAIDRAIKVLRSDVDALLKQSAAPWYRDKRFYAGVASVPALLLSGWLVNWALDGDGTALRLVHRGFGTEPALGSALKDDASEFTKQLEPTIGKWLQNRTGALAGALHDSLKDKKVLTEGTLVQTLSKELREYVGARHATFKSVGLTDPSRLRLVTCDDRQCLDARAGWTKSASVVFGANPDKKVDIELGISIRQYSLDTSGKSDVPRSDDVTRQSKLSEHLVVRLDEGPPLVFSPVGAQMQRYNLDGVEYTFEQFKATSQAIGSQAFPMHSLRFEVAPNVATDKVIHIIAVVSQSN